jgi:hypothetical protein
VVANTDQFDVQPAPSIVAADDVWIRTGVWNAWDVTVGRMQGFDVYPLGMGLDLNTYERLGAYDPLFTGSPNGPGAVPALYNAEYLFYRPSAPRVSDLALHLYAGPLRFELLGQFGNDGVRNTLGARPAAILDLGFFKLRAAAEYQYKFAEDPAPTAKNVIKNSGLAGSAQVVFAPFVEAGINFGYASIDVFDQKNPDGDKGLSGNRLSVGGFVDFNPLWFMLPNLLAGAGFNYATFHNILMDQEESTNEQMFGAIQYIFYKQLYVKFVVGYAKSHFQNLNTSAPYDDDMFSARLRVMYLF